MYSTTSSAFSQIQSRKLFIHIWSCDTLSLERLSFAWAVFVEWTYHLRTVRLVIHLRSTQNTCRTINSWFNSIYDFNSLIEFFMIYFIASKSLFRETNPFWHWCFFGILNAVTQTCFWPMIESGCYRTYSCK